MKTTQPTTEAFTARKVFHYPGGGYSPANLIAPTEPWLCDFCHETQPAGSDLFSVYNSEGLGADVNRCETCCETNRGLW